jgi:hypothetical protein
MADFVPLRRTQRSKLGHSPFQTRPPTAKLGQYRKMDLRHAAALALVGWYLMAPPMTADKKVLTDAPFSGWLIVGSYDSADACSTNLTKLRVSSEQWESWRRERTMRSACISTDDPRLIPK